MSEQGSSFLPQNFLQTISCHFGVLSSTPSNTVLVGLFQKSLPMLWKEVNMVEVLKEGLFSTEKVRYYKTMDQPSSILHTAVPWQD